MGAANVEPAPLRVPEPDPDDPPLDELLLHAAPASRMPIAASATAALRETGPPCTILITAPPGPAAAFREAAPPCTILITAPPGLTARPGPACAAGVLDE